MTALDAAQEAGRIRFRPILMTSVATVMGALPIALGLGAGSLSRRPLGYAIVGGLIFSTLLTLYVVPAVYLIFDGLLERSARRRTSGKVFWPRRRPTDAALAARAPGSPLQQDSIPAADSVPRITLAEALSRSTQLDPDYVQALGQIDNAEWGRRAAMLAFFVPTISVGLDETKYSQEFFNPANPANPTSTLVVGRASANYEIFSLRKFADVSRSKADLASAEAGELEQRFRAALETESSYYDVLVNQELTRVTQERVTRARQGLAVARARVYSGAAVQTDSLQLVLELIRAQVEVLRQRNALRTAQLELGRRVGVRARSMLSGRHRCATAASHHPDRSAADRLGSGSAVSDGRANESAADADLSAAGRLSAGSQHRRRAPAIRHAAVPRRGEHHLAHLQPVLPALGQWATRDRAHPSSGQSRRGAGHPGRSRARGAARRHQRVRHLRDRHRRRRAGPCGGDRGPADLSDAGPALSRRAPAPFSTCSTPRSASPRQKPGWSRPDIRPGWPWRARSHSRTPTLLEQGCSVKLDSSTQC